MPTTCTSCSTGTKSGATADVERAFTDTVAHLTAPLLGASATTALGMLSLATSDVVAVRSFGIGSAVGIMVDFVISLVLMPTLLSLVKPETAETPHERYLLPPLRRVAKWSTRHPGRVLTASIACGLLLSLGIFRLRVDTNHINFFSRNHPLGQSAAVIDNKLAGVYSYQLMLEGPPDSLKRPDMLARMNQLQEELRRAPHVRKVTSVADYVKRIHRELNDGRSEANVIPSDAETIAQELFVFTLGGDGRHELERVVASDFSRAQITVKLQAMSSDLVLEEVEAADRRAREIFAGTGVSVLTTGSGRLFSTLDHYLVVSQMSSFGTAFVTVFGVIFVVFRSFRFGLLTIVPNVLPVVAVLGVMGYLGISMNIATVMVASVALGVVDDDTIHFINRYRREVAAGASTDEAIETATAHEGRASLTTAIINSCGYGVLLLSEYKPTAWFGGLLALTMAVAFLAEVLILPATIKLLPWWLGAEAVRKRRGAAAAAIVVLCLCLPGISSAQSVGRPSGHVSLTGRLRAQSPRHAGAAQPAVRRGEDRGDAVAARHRVGVRGRAAGKPPGSAGRRDRRGSKHHRHRRRLQGSGRLCRADRRAARRSRRLCAGRVGPARRNPAHRRRESSRRLAFLLRGAQRGAPVGGAGPRPRVPVGRGVRRSRLRPVLPPRPLRSSRRADVAVQPAQSVPAKDSVCAWPSAARRCRRRSSTTAAGRRCERAGRCAVQRDDGPGRLGGVGIPRPGAVRDLSDW